jgi:hypothetical protein
MANQYFPGAHVQPEPVYLGFSGGHEQFANVTGTAFYLDRPRLLTIEFGIAVDVSFPAALSQPKPDMQAQVFKWVHSSSSPGEDAYYEQFKCRIPGPDPKIVKGYRLTDAWPLFVVGTYKFNDKWDYLPVCGPVIGPDAGIGLSDRQAQGAFQIDRYFLVVTVTAE